MTDTAQVSRDRQRPQCRSGLVDPELADQLLAKAEAQGVELLGPDRRLSQVTKAVLERALSEAAWGGLRRRARGRSASI
jgi:hypothetical protein